MRRLSSPRYRRPTPADFRVRLKAEVHQQLLCGASVAGKGSEGLRTAPPPTLRPARRKDAANFLGEAQGDILGQPAPLAMALKLGIADVDGQDDPCLIDLVVESGCVVDQPAILVDKPVENGA